jgi:hypothetical protein
MRLARAAIAISAASVVLGAGAWAGGAFAFSARSAASTFAYPARVDEISIGDALRVAGQPMRLSLFFTPDPPARVARFYLDAFRARGLLPVMASDADLAHVSAFDPASGLQRFVSALPRPEGQTLVLTGATHPRQPPRFLRGSEGASFPVPPASGAFLGFSSEDSGARAESAQFMTALPPGEVASFYRRALGEQGYAERRDGAGEGLLIFLRAGATVTVALQSLDEKGGAAVFVTRVEGEGGGGGSRR